MRIEFIPCVTGINLPAFDPNQWNLSEVTLKEAAQRLNLSPLSVRHLIERKILPAQQVVECAPWQIPADSFGL